MRKNNVQSIILHDVKNTFKKSSKSVVSALSLLIINNKALLDRLAKRRKLVAMWRG